MIIFETGQPDTIVHRLDPRLRVIAAFGFAVLVLVCARPAALAFAFALALGLGILARIPPRTVLRRLAELNAFLLLLALLLPLSAGGEPLLAWGRLRWSRDGLAQVALLAVRANTIVLALGALLATMPPSRLGAALHRLGCPAKLVHVLLFMVRYIEVIHQEYHRLRHAMLLRGFRARCDRHTLRAFGYLVGQLLVRSLDRSERVLAAMLCRGFRGQLHVLVPFHWGRRDWGFAALTVVGFAVLIWLESPWPNR